MIVDYILKRHMQAKIIQNMYIDYVLQNLFFLCCAFTI